MTKQTAKRWAEDIYFKRSPGLPAYVADALRAFLRGFPAPKAAAKFREFADALEKEQ